jgi:negative regulator of flagellin synthesis FlgM
MDISVNAVNNARNIYVSNNQKFSPTERARQKEEQKNVSLVISDEGLEALAKSQAAKAVKEAPDIRAEKVEALKRKIDQGEYFVSSEDIAEKIINSYESLTRPLIRPESGGKSFM